MPSAQASLFVLTGILLVMATIVWRARPHASANRWFAGHTVLIAGWVLGIAGLHGGSHLDYWGRLAFASGSLMPCAFLGFTRCYPVPSAWPSSRILVFVFGVGTFFALLALTTPLIVYDVNFDSGALSRKTGLLYPAFTLYFLIGWCSAFVVFYMKWRRSSGLARAQLQYLWAGLVIPVAGGITTNLLVPLLTGRSTYSWVGPYFSLLLVAIVGHAIIRHRLMDLRIAVHRGLAYLASAALISAIIILIGREAVTNWSSLPATIPADLLIAVLVTLALLSAPGQTLLGKLLNPYLYRGRVDHASALREATHRLTRLMQPAQLANELRVILEDVFVPESFSMVARPVEGGVFEQLASTRQDDVDHTAVVDLVTVATLLADRQRASVLLVNPSLYTGALHTAHGALQSAGVEVLCILERRGILLGAIFFGPRRSGDAYFAKDLSFVESLAELASVALENALLYRQSLHMLEYSNRLLESLDSGVVAIDALGRITSFNPTSVSLLGLDKTRVGSFLDDLPSEVGWAVAFAVKGTWRAFEVETSIEHATRGSVPILLSATALHDQNANITGALAVITDLATVKALERNQRRIEHFALMARFYAGIAHEIRSPLTAISNFVAMLPDRFDDPEYRDVVARLLPLEVARIVRLADRLRLMAPSEGGQLREVSLSSLLADLLAIHSPAAEEAGVSLILDTQAEAATILGDPGQLVQLFLNLIRNAVDAMPDGGSVLVRCFVTTDNTTAVVEIIDEGTGIDPSIRPKVFQPFFTTKPHGTGLGLAICREIADFHRALLTLQPGIGQQGAVARIEFPMTSRDQAMRQVSRDEDTTVATSQHRG